MKRTTPTTPSPAPQIRNRPAREGAPAEQRTSALQTKHLEPQADVNSLAAIQRNEHVNHHETVEQAPQGHCAHQTLTSCPFPPSPRRHRYRRNSSASFCDDPRRCRNGMVIQFKWIEIVLPKYLARRVDLGNSPIRLARKSNNLLRNRIAIRTSRLNGFQRERRLKNPETFLRIFCSQNNIFFGFRAYRTRRRRGRSPN